MKQTKVSTFFKLPNFLFYVFFSGHIFYFFWFSDEKQHKLMWFL